MNEQQRAVVQQALDAFDHLHSTGDTQVFDMCYAPELIPALRQLLEQPVQEHDHALEQALTRLQKRYSELEAKVGAQPADWVGLTEEELYAVRVPMSPEEIARAVEAKLREKNGGAA
jgi:hypothetical protein